MALYPSAELFPGANVYPVLLATETWTGADGAAWPSQWTVVAGGAGSAATIQANAGRSTYATATGYVSGCRPFLTGIASRDFDITVTVTFPVIQEQYLQIMGRAASDAANGYGVNLYPHFGTATIGIVRWDNTGLTSLTGDLQGGAWTANVPRKVRVQAIGDTIRCKVWDASGVEPTAWLGTVTDTMWSATTGGVAFETTTGNTTSGSYVTLDDLSVTDGSDSIAPSVPANVTARADSSTEVGVAWNASTDAVGVTSYRVRRGGVDLPGATAVAGTSFMDTSVAASTAYSYTVSAVDAAGNRSAESAVVTVTTPPQPAAPTPLPVPPPVVAAPQMVVTLYGPDYVRLGQVPNYISCSVTWQYIGLGSGQLVVGEDDPSAGYLLGAADQMVAVVVQVGDTRWSGRVSTVTLERNGPAGSGVISATLVDEWIWLQRMLASQNAANAALTTMPLSDTRTGPAVSVAADYINVAATRLGVPVRATKPAVDNSPSISLNARMTVLADLLTAPLKDAGVTMTGLVWLPGDPQPLNVTTALTTPTVVFVPQVLADKPWLQWTDAMTNLGGVTFQGNQPTAYRAIIGLAGDGTARVYDSYVMVNRQTAMGTFGLPEIFVDATDVGAVGTQSQNAGREALAETGPTTAAVFTVADSDPWQYGSDYVVGDVATLAVGTASWRQRITRVTADDDRETGLVFTPLIGDQTPDVSGDDMMVRALGRVAEGLRALRSGR